MPARSPARRAVILGMDGASFELVEHMVNEGHAPNIGRLMERGASRGMWGVFPTLTPPGWTALTTGAWPGTHGVMDFNIHLPGRHLEDTEWGINTALCQAEYLWNTAERAGRIPILVKWEMSWPPTVTRGIQVEGTGPGVSNYHQIAGYHLFTSRQRRGEAASRDSQAVDPSALAAAGRTDPVVLRPVEPGTWVHLPPSARLPLEAELIVRPLHRGQPRMLRGKHGEPKRYFALILASGAAGYDRVLVTRERDAAAPLADLRPRAWSDWVREAFTIDGAPVEGHVRFKLLELSPEADDFALFLPQIWPVDGYTHPPEIAHELLDACGPFLQNPARDALGLIDDDTYFELVEYHLQWLAAACHHLAHTRAWDLLFCENHVPDYANHFFVPRCAPISGAPPDVVKRSYRGVVRSMEAVDRWVGRLLELDDGETLFVLISDHGGTPERHRQTQVADALAQAGLLVYTTDGTGRRRIDWARTKAAPVGLVHVFINLKGREPEGIVDPADYTTVQRQIVDALLDYRDPQTGERPFVLALPRADAEALNLWGELVGDVVYALRPEYDGAHGKQLPSARFGFLGQHSTLVLAGPNVRRGVRLRRQARSVDVAPTICYLLGLPVPRQCEGGVLYEALEDPDWYLHHT
jgi:predicted AlkP superfamily phosphohydrolase/phosphomutase